MHSYEIYHFLIKNAQFFFQMHQTICIVTTLLAGICQAIPDHHPGIHHHPVHHQAVHHSPVHHQTVHHAPIHHQAVHHAPVHHQAVHHTPVHHAPTHHQAVHHTSVHHQNVHHEPVHPAPEQTYEPTEDVVDIAVGNKDFSTLVKIVSDLGLVDTLKNAEAVTILAPTDAAFAKLPAGTLESLTPEQVSFIFLLINVIAAIFYCQVPEKQPWAVCQVFVQAL